MFPSGSEISHFIKESVKIKTNEGHKLWIKNLFDVISEAQPRLSDSINHKFFHSIIITNEPNEGIVHHAIRGYSEARYDKPLNVDGVYSMAGRLLGLNEAGCSRFLFDGDFKLLSRSAKVFPVHVPNFVDTGGIGIVTMHMKDAAYRDYAFSTNAFTIVKHKDYDNIHHHEVEFLVEYVQPPWDSIKQPSEWAIPGNEVILRGHIVGRNPKNFRWIISLYSVHVNSAAA